MKRTIYLLAASVLLLLSCGYRPAGPSAEETRQLESFTGIGVSVSANITYTPGPIHEISIEGEEQDVKELVTRVENGYLKIRYTRNRIQRSRLTIHITSEELNRISISGSAKFKSSKALSPEEMGIAISGSGNIYYRGDPRVNTTASGSGKVRAL